LIQSNSGVGLDRCHHGGRRDLFLAHLDGALSLSLSFSGNYLGASENVQTHTVQQSAARSFPRRLAARNQVQLNLFDFARLRRV